MNAVIQRLEPYYRHEAWKFLEAEQVGLSCWATDEWGIRGEQCRAHYQWSTVEEMLSYVVEWMRHGFDWAAAGIRIELVIDGVLLVLGKKLAWLVLEILIYFSAVGLI
jgi:hypothetical protein